MSGELLRVGEDGQTSPVPNTYEGIKEALNGGTLDFVPGPFDTGFYIDDNGLVNELPLNVAASMMAFRPLFGPAVMAARDPDDEGETLPPPEDAVKAQVGIAMAWRSVLLGAIAINQDLTFRPNADVVPPPTVVGLTDEAFDQWMRSGRLSEP